MWDQPMLASCIREPIGRRVGLPNRKCCLRHYPENDGGRRLTAGVDDDYDPGGPMMTSLTKSTFERRRRAVVFSPFHDGKSLKYSAVVVITVDESLVGRNFNTLST
ncbi:hypothetical protein GW17_00042605 [Ensete ventricosum]|nr:hypothetical protein GW17_00042605 [Ensete ventricosum]RZS12066.1 hypothetical protein BHM03_00043457 [Ensete ventricosum]